MNKVATVVRGEWLAALEREGTVPVQAAMFGEGEHPPCPACGTAAPLVDALEAAARER